MVIYGKSARVFLNNERKHSDPLLDLKLYQSATLVSVPSVQP